MKSRRNHLRPAGRTRSRKIQVGGVMVIAHYKTAHMTYATPSTCQPNQAGLGWLRWKHFESGLPQNRFNGIWTAKPGGKMWTAAIVGTLRCWKIVFRRHPDLAPSEAIIREENKDEGIILFFGVRFVFLPHHGAAISKQSLARVRHVDDFLPLVGLDACGNPRCLGGITAPEDNASFWRLFRRRRRFRHFHRIMPCSANRTAWRRHLSSVKKNLSLVTTMFAWFWSTMFFTVGPFTQSIAWRAAAQSARRNRVCLSGQKTWTFRLGWV